MVVREKRMAYFPTVTIIWLAQLGAMILQFSTAILYHSGVPNNASVIKSFYYIDGLCRGEEIRCEMISFHSTMKSTMVVFRSWLMLIKNLHGGVTHTFIKDQNGNRTVKDIKVNSEMITNALVWITNLIYVWVHEDKHTVWFVRIARISGFVTQSILSRTKQLMFLFGSKPFLFNSRQSLEQLTLHISTIAIECESTSTNVMLMKYSHLQSLLDPISLKFCIQIYI